MIKADKKFFINSNGCTKRGAAEGSERDEELLLFSEFEGLTSFLSTEILMIINACTL